MSESRKKVLRENAIKELKEEIYQEWIWCFNYCYNKSFYEIKCGICIFNKFCKRKFTINSTYDKEIKIEICESCGDKAEYQCIENQEKYCRNCKILMNVNGAGIEIDDYHFKKIK